MQKEVYESGEESKEIFQSILVKPFRLAYDEDKAIKKALVLKEWISAEGTCKYGGGQVLKYHFFCERDRLVREKWKERGMIIGTNLYFKT